MQTEKQVGQGIPLRLAEWRQEIGALREDASGGVVDQIEKRDRDGDQDESRHRQSEFRTHPLEQVGESQDRNDREDRVEELAPMAMRSEERRVGKECRL